MSATEVFANQPFATVTSGGTDPVSGDEIWTVFQNPAAPFPAAVTGVSQFHVTDTNTTAASEIILVTNVVSTTWFVTRGAEGTTPVAHQPDFTITQVLTAGWLAGVNSGVNAVDNGGTGLVTAAAYALLAGGTASTSPFQQVASLGTSGQVLTSQGAGSLPAWTSQSGLVNPMTTHGDMIYESAALTPAALPGNTASTKKFLTSAGSGGTANTPAWGTIASSDIGIVAVLNGGTGGTAATTFAVVTGGTSATTPFQQVSGLGTVGQALTSNGAAALPSWQQTFTGLMEPLASPVTSAGSPYSASAGQYVPVDTTGGNVTVNLPSGAADKTIVGIKHVIQGGTFAVTYNTTGGAVFNKTGGGTTGTLTLPSQGIITQYAAAGTIWYIYADDLPLSQLDLRYVTQSSLPLGVGSGGTGLGSLTTFALVTGGTASTTAVQQIAAGTAGTVLTGNGAGTLPSFQAPSAANLTGNVTITHGGTGAGNAPAAITALTNPQGAGEYLRSDGTNATLSALKAGDLTGTVAVGNGGTGGTQATAYALLAGGTAATSPFQQVSGLGTAGQGLLSNGAGTLPSWQTTVNSVTAADTTILVAGTGLTPTLSSPRHATQAAKYSGVAGQPPRESIPFWAATTNNVVTAGVMYLMVIPVEPGDVISNVGFQAGATAAFMGTNPNWWTALYTPASGSTATFVAQSGTQGSTAIGGASAHMLALGSGAPYTVLAGTTYVYGAVMINTGSGGTQPTMRGPSMNAATVDASTSLFPTSAIYSGTNGTSLAGSAPTGTITLAVNANLLYLGAD